MDISNTKLLTRSIIANPYKINQILDSLNNWRCLFKMCFKNYKNYVNEYVKITILKRLFNQNSGWKFKMTILGFEYLIFKYFDELKNTKYFIEYCKIWKFYVDYDVKFKQIYDFESIINYFINLGEFELLDSFLNSKFFIITKFNEDIKNKLIIHRPSLINYIVNVYNNIFDLNILVNLTESEIINQMNNLTLILNINHIKKINKLLGSAVVKTLLKNCVLTNYIKNEIIEYVEKHYPDHLKYLLNYHFSYNDYKLYYGYENHIVKLILNSGEFDYSIFLFLNKYLITDYFTNVIMVTNLDFVYYLVNNSCYDSLRSSHNASYLFTKWYNINGSIFTDKIINMICYRYHNDDCFYLPDVLSMLNTILGQKQFLFLDREYLISNLDSFHFKIRKTIEPHLNTKIIKSAKNR